LKADLSIGVIVPVLNERAGLPALIKRIAAMPADEVVIVDGGSTDGSCLILDASALRWITAPSGRAAQMNAGAMLSESDILLFIHSDTEIGACCFPAIKAAMQDGATVGGRFDVKLSGSHPAFRMIERLINLRSRLSGISTGDQCLFVRRSVFERMAGFPLQPLMEDIEFSKQLKRLGRIACLHQRVTTSSRRWQQHGIVKTVLLMWRLRLLYWLGVPAERLAAAYRQVR